jgi:4-hydroxy-tetrahydrodipicolinate reductase
VSERPRIILCGATGRTGNVVAHALVARDDVDVLACVAPSVATRPSRPLPEAAAAFATLVEALDASPDVDVVVDLTHAAPAAEHAELALERGLPIVIGATGLDGDLVEQLGTRFAERDLGVMLVPNFSIGAVLAARMAHGVATYFPDAEIVEVHHDGKRDSPSGTAVRTAQLIAKARRASGLEPGAAAAQASAGDSPARGESIEGVPVHALRLPGATAHQEVVFGAPGEMLTIRHDAIDRSCYAAGVVAAARYVRDLRGLEIGLEHVI